MKMDYSIKLRIFGGRRQPSPTPYVRKGQAWERARLAGRWAPVASRVFWREIALPTGTIKKQCRFNGKETVYLPIFQKAQPFFFRVLQRMTLRAKTLQFKLRV